jgi:spoIIIJ-associated protein
VSDVSTLEPGEGESTLQPGDGPATLEPGDGEAVCDSGEVTAVVPAPDDGSADQATAAEATADDGNGRSQRQRLEEEGDVAADYLEELLDILDLDGDIDIDVENGRASVSVIGDSGSQRSLRRLVGSAGEVLEALQELTRLAVQTKTGERSRLMLDVAGFRLNRRRELESVAATAVDSVRTTSEPVALDPMSPFERKVVHDVVAAAGLRSESEGEGADRHVVVHPAG